MINIHHHPMWIHVTFQFYLAASTAEVFPMQQRLFMISVGDLLKPWLPGRRCEVLVPSGTIACRLGGLRNQKGGRCGGSSPTTCPYMSNVSNMFCVNGLKLPVRKKLCTNNFQLTWMKMSWYKGKESVITKLFKWLSNLGGTSEKQPMGS